MIRPFTTLCLVAAFGSGMYLYTEKHRAELLDRHIARVMHETEAARQRTGLLRADWALLNDPTRLQDMADKYLALKPMAPGQFVQLADLANHLPAPVTTPPGGSTDDDAQVADTTTPATPPAAEAPPAAPSVPEVKQVAKSNPPAADHENAKLVAHAAPRKPLHPVVMANREAAPHDDVLAPTAPLPLASPRPVGARVMSALARPAHLAVRSAVAEAVPSALGAAYVGSALGGHTSVPAPVPLGAQ
jgi:hypothetical protein